ncbi:MAG TPA: type III pantothenate kinase [Rudaea sp.]|nr:type III pantothenate kinase [Rudaea sp.]
MKLLIDIGNTRLKWVMWDGRLLHDARAIGHREASASGFAALWKDAHSIESAWIASVGSPALETAVADCLRAQLNCPVEFALSQAHACGVTSAYVRAADLGVDRFLGMIAAHAQETSASVIASCGTAMTLDALAADGTHLGGLITPGMRLMREALRVGTARLENVPSGHIVQMADNTADAIASGIQWTIVAAIERFVAHAAARFDGEPALILTGGDACEVSALLAIPHRIDADIVLRGLALFADSHTKR